MNNVLNLKLIVNNFILFDKIQLFIIIFNNIIILFYNRLSIKKMK
jgi:hypothetical protein